MKRRFICWLALLTGTAGVQAQSSQPALLADARSFVTHLKLEQNTDQALFQMTGAERSKQWMEMVVHAGLDVEATIEDWANLHKALAGEVELAIQEGNVGGAMASLARQRTYYNGLESDYAASLRTSRQTLEIEKKNQPALLPFGYDAIGDDLGNLGRTPEALDAFQEARRLSVAFGEPAANIQQQKWFATLWLKIVEAEIQLRDLAAARNETAQFLAAAEPSSSALRPRALMASADLMVAEGRFSAAIDALKQVRELANDQDTRSSLNLDVAKVASAMVSETLGSLDYAQAMITAKRIQMELGDMLVVEPLVQASLLVRRRLAGDLDGVLRQLTQALVESRAAGDTFGQIEALEALAATYSGFNSLDNQIAALDEALALTRSVLPLNGLPDRPAIAGLYFGVLELLGSSYVDARQLGKASLMFQEMEQKLSQLTKARVCLYARQHFGAELIIGQARVLNLQSRRGEAKELLLGVLAGKADPARYNRGAVLEQLARLERDSRDVPAAAGYYELAVASFAEQRDANHELMEHLEYAQFLLTNASTFPDTLEKARTHLETAAQQTGSVNQFQARWRTEYEFGLLAENTGDRLGAIARYRTAVARLEEVRVSLSQQEGRQSLLDNDLVQDLNTRLISLLTDSGKTSEVWQSTERAKARSFIELLGGRHIPSADAAPELKVIDNLEKQILNVKVQLAPESSAAQTRSGRDPNVLRTELYELEHRFALARQQDNLENTRAGQSVALGSISLDAARKLLPPKTTLLEYAFLRDGITAFVITRSSTMQLRWQLNPNELGRKVKEQLLPLLAVHSPDAEVDAALTEVSHWTCPHF